MTEFAAVHTTAKEATAAGRDLAAQIKATMDGTPDVLLVFASSAYDSVALLQALQDAIAPGILVGSSSAGEFTHGTAVVLVIAD